MDELAELKRRVDSAVEHLVAAQNARRQQQDSLIQLLADLEVKFDARHEELAYCHSRISSLEKANGQLTELLNTVVHLIESGSIEDPNDPIFRASQMAAELVRLCASKPNALAGRTRDAEPARDTVTFGAEETDSFASIRKPAATVPPLELPVEMPAPAINGDDDQGPAVTAHGPAKGTTEVPARAAAASAPTAAGQNQQFDDVSNDELEVEALLDDMPEENTVPAALAQAVAAADGGGRDAAGWDLSDRVNEISGAIGTAQRTEPDGFRAEPPAHAAEQPIDDPGMDTVVDFDVVDLDEVTTLDATGDREAAAGGDDADIKVLMARIQEAAEKARSRSDAREVAVSNRTPPTQDKTGTH